MDLTSNEPSSVFTLKPFETSPTIAKLFEALCKAQGEMKPAVMDMENPHFRSKYASLTSCKDACQDPFFRHGIAYVQPVFSFDNHYYIRTQIVHAGEWIASTMKLTLSKQDMQGVGSAITYAKRYALSAMVGIVDTEDDDGNAAVGKDKETKDEIPAYRKPVPKTSPQAPRTAPVVSPKPTQADLLGDTTGIDQSTHLDRLMSIVSKRGIPIEEMPGIIKRSIGMAKSRHDLTNDEIEKVLKRINLFPEARLAPPSENGRGQVMTDKSAPTFHQSEFSP